MKDPDSKFKEVNLLAFTACLKTVVTSVTVFLLSLNAHGQATDAETDEQVFVLDAFEVSGYADSFAYAQEVKKQANQIVDVIASEEIGKLPDTNIADALQRVTGVQILRDGFGEGQSVSVRGTVNNRVEINGRGLTGSDANTRSVDFSDLSPALFESIEVIKSPTADMTEGSLGATIRLRTRKPLLRGPKMPWIAYTNAEIGIYDRVHGEYPAFSTNFGYNWRDTPIGDIGFMTTISSRESKVRADNFSTLRWMEVAKGAPGTGNFFFNIFYKYDLNEDGVVDPSDSTYPDRYFHITRLNLLAQERKTSTLAWNGTLEWKPNDDWQIILESSISDATEETYGTRSDNILAGDTDTAFADVTWDENLGMIKERMTRTQVEFSPSPNSSVVDRSTKEIGLTIRHDGRGNLKSEVSAGHSKSDRDSIFWLLHPNFVGPRTTIIYDFQGAEGGIPFISYEDEAFRADSMDPSSYRLRSWNYIELVNNTSDTFAALDFDYDFSNSSGWLSSVEFGVRHNERTADRTQNQLYAPTPRGLIPVELNEQYLFSNPFSDMGGGIPRAEQFHQEFLTTVGTNYEQFLESFEIGNSGKSMWDYIREDKDVGFDVTEENLAGYMKANFWGTLFGKYEFLGNAGIRVVKTKTHSEGYFEVTGEEDDLRIEERSYTEVLPSFNLSVMLTEKLAVRTAVAGVMSRPNLIDLSTSTSLNPTSLDPDGFPTGIGGNPDLDPYTATQYDLSLEWYRGKGRLISMAFFLKDIQASILTGERIETYDLGDGNGPTEFAVRRPFNGPSTMVKGIEFTFQQVFESLPSPLDGLGINLNYTHTIDDEDSIDYDGDPIPLQGLSEDSMNVVVFYEYKKFGARIAYNYRSDYVVLTTSANGRPTYRASTGQIDLSAYYDLTRNLRLTLSMVNLNEQLQTDYTKYSNFVDRIYNPGSRTFIGLRYRW